MVTKRNSLGRGLGSLLNNNNQNNSLFEEIDINQIEINPNQPRKKFNDKSLKELSISIKNYGIIQPITVRKLSENRFQLISGERRFRASKLSGIQTIPSFIKDADEKEILELALIENIQREDLNSIEISVSYKKLLDDLKISQDELAEKVGKDIAIKAKKNGLETVVFDRGGYLYHGRVKSLAEGARSNGLKF